MQFVLDDRNFVVIDSGSYITRAGIGVADTNVPPSVEITTSQFGRPFVRGEINSWEDFESLIRHILFHKLRLVCIRNESPVLLTLPSRWTKEQYERVTQIFFESFNVPGMYIAEQPLMALYGAGAVSGVVVDIGHETTDVTAIVDSTITPISFSIPIAGKEMEEYLLQFLQSDETLQLEINSENIKDDTEATSAVSRDKSQPPIQLDLEFARFVKESGICNVSPLVRDSERAEIEYRGRKFTIGPYRRHIMNALFEPSLLDLSEISLPEAIRTSIQSCDPPEIRNRLWENIVLTGGCALLPGIQERLLHELIPYLALSENAGDTQGRDVKFLKIPEYFTVLKDHRWQGCKAWLGGEIVAKLVFQDPKNYVSKIDYNEHGPSVVHTKSY